MHGNLSTNSKRTIPALEANFHQRKNSSEPLWFALMCRELWGTNAPKELRFMLGDKWTDRTYRAWTSGDNEPPAGVLWCLMSSAEFGERILTYLMRDSDLAWWADIQRARRIVAAEDAIDRS